MRTYTEDELRAEVDRAVAEATGSLSARLAEFEGKESQAVVEAAVTAAVEEANGRIAELEGQLDAAVIKANESAEAHDSLVAYLSEQAAEAERQALIAARRTERVGQVREVANFTDAQLEERADRWAAMEDDEFAAALADYRDIAAAAAAGTVANTAEIPSATAMTAAASSPPAGAGRRTSAIQGALALRGTPVAPSTIN